MEHIPILLTSSLQPTNRRFVAYGRFVMRTKHTLIGISLIGVLAAFAPCVASAQVMSLNYHDRWTLPFFEQSNYDEQKWETQSIYRHDDSDFVRLGSPDSGHPVPIRFSCPTTCDFNEVAACKLTAGNVDY